MQITLSLQQIFDTIWKRWVVNGDIGGVAFDSGGNSSPRYHAGCAVGMFIPSELYKPEIEKFNISEVLNSFPAIAAYFKPIHPTYLVELQEIHDDACMAKYWEQSPLSFREIIEPALRKFATRYDLRYELPPSPIGSRRQFTSGA